MVGYPGMASNEAQLMPDDSIHESRCTGLQPIFSRVQITADAGPRTNCQRDLAFANLRYNFCQTRLILDRIGDGCRLHMHIQDLICPKGVVTLGSAAELAKRPVLKAH